MVGEAICKANFIGDKRHSWVVDADGESCCIETDSRACAVVYLIGDSVVGVEADDNCACKIIEPLIEIYGFEKVKWLGAK
jgi:hypothetical protein